MSRCQDPNPPSHPTNLTANEPRQLFTALLAPKFSLRSHYLENISSPFIRTCHHLQPRLQWFPVHKWHQLNDNVYKLL